jgi:hypothetical protein
MIGIESHTRWSAPPSWALWQRQLLATMSDAVEPFLAKYTNPDGTLIWCGRLHRGDSADDFYEPFYNWPLLYLLGGDDRLLELSLRQWEAMLRQLDAMGQLHQEYERYSDQFHQSEANLFFYLLCLADPDNLRLREQAARFARFFTDPHFGNYDPALRLIRSPINGSEGPHPYKADRIYAWHPAMRVYGLPFDDVPGVSHFDDLKDPALARVMGRAMHERMSRGDAAANLSVSSLVAHAYLLSGKDEYRRWVGEYVGVWQERARQNGGMLPDNVGLSGQVGEYLDGKWYGGLYGWAWPHGYYSVGMASMVAAQAALLVSGDGAALDLPRIMLQRMLERSRIAPVNRLSMTLRHHFGGLIDPDKPDQEALVIPYRHNDAGWFDEHPVGATIPTAIWFLGQRSEDWDRLQYLRAHSGVDWRRFVPFRNKEDAGHEPPWLCFLAGENPDYPETFLRYSYAQVAARLDRIRNDQEDLREVSDEEIDVKVHHWQLHNPVTTEALVQLTLGAPQLLYNGGLLMASLRYFDAERKRPGLPADVAALVQIVEAERVVVELVNLSVFAVRELIVQAGAFAEHELTLVRYSSIEQIDETLIYPGAQQTDAATPRAALREEVAVSVNGRYLAVRLHPATSIRLAIGLRRYVYTPSARFPV